MARQLIIGEKPVACVGSAKCDFLEFPEPVKGEMGNVLGIAQFGGKHPSAKPWKGQGPGVFEVVEDFDGDTYRAVYTVKFHEVVYVLHAFQKKSPKGIRTTRGDIELVERRLKLAREDYEARYGKEK
ncbi:MAG: type II toxin-antitoxin system RelE/ParE family toxin [Alphaproteobacteria bacterium]|nr:type II toxin-antitoxin system RelE/ParE family toxin [Alphaproteobacteria bacterium]MDE2110087.1 type II toxin-antitoxin system RelE/ParE family toxin [Alphaproteobacteria bacterium]MDE2495113.1 type II toxin-antitoxin system RelE/ParE family toxin [Alphaproteobacteria bacterium]